MLCDSCKSRPAEVHLVSVIDGERTVRHLCRECAEGNIHLEDIKGIMKLSIPLGGLEELGEMLKDIVMPTFAGEERRAKKVRYCPHCGAELPDSMFDDMPQAKPAPVQKPQTAADEIALLAKKMKSAVKAEKYEAAAQLRDKIERLKNERSDSGTEETK